jgi:hypothetical protein
MSYPIEEDKQVLFWQTQIGFSQEQAKEEFQAGNVLAKQFFNEAATSREEETRDAIQEEVVRRTKSNIIFGYIDQYLSNILDRAPVFQLFPETREAAAKIDPNDPSSLTLSAGTSKIVNYRYRESHQLSVDERVARDAMIYPYGVAKIGFEVDVDELAQELLQENVELELEDPEEENSFLSIGNPVLVTDNQDHRWHIETHVAFLQSMDFVLLPASQAAVAEQAIREHIALHRKFDRRRAPSSNTNVKRGSPWAVRWPPWLFVTDTFSMEGLQDCRWCAFGWELPIEAVQANPNYRNTSDIKPIRVSDSPDKHESFGEGESDGLDMIRGWEIWAKRFPTGNSQRNKHEDLLLTIVEGHDKFIQKETEWPYDRIDDYPASTVVYQPGLKKWFHKSPMIMGGGDTVQALINEILDSFLSIIRKQKNIWLVDPRAGLDANKIQEIIQAPDPSVIQVPGLSELGSGAIIPLPFHQIPPDKNNMLGVLLNMFDRAMGTPQPNTIPDSDSASEANINERRNTSRENRMSAIISDFQLDKAKKMWQLDAQYQPDKLFLLDKNAQSFLSISKEMALGEYQFTMDVTSHSTQLAVERSQWMDLLNLFAGLTPVMIETFGFPPNLPELARRLLVRGFSEKVVEEILPVLQQAATAQAQRTPLPPEEIGQGPGLQPGTEEGEGAAQAVNDGRLIDRGVGPLQPETFNRDQSPSEGRTVGSAETG